MTEARIVTTPKKPAGRGCTEALSCRLGRTWLLGAFAVAAALGLGGCATSGGSGGGAAANEGLLDKALQMVGLSKPQIPELPIKDLPLGPSKITLRVHAGEVLNTDAAGRPLSVVARVYKLRASEAFLQAPYEAFQNTAADKPAPFAADVLESREVVLTPGMRHEVVETMGLGAKYLGVVALFRSPAPARWRFVFDTKGSVASGVTVGVHACALSVSQGQTVNATAESLRLAGVRCQ